MLVGAIPDRYDYRCDLTAEKVYSFQKSTASILRDLRSKPLQVSAFYLQDDPARRGLEIFLRECQRQHPDFHFDFYDPVRRPTLAKKFQVTTPATIIIRSGDHEERIVTPNEEAFTNAFLRILHPRTVDVCFVKGHGEVELRGDEPVTYDMFRTTLEGFNTRVNEIVLSRDHVPDACQVVALAGPRWEPTPEEFDDLKKAFRQGKGLLLLLDPMDPGTGKAFPAFAKSMGVALGDNVVVDKASRIVGGDFLMPLVSQYFVRHPVSKTMKQATFFPLLRSVQPSTDTVPGFEVVPLAMTGPGSWAESNLSALEDGTVTFDPKSDIAGPLPAAIAVEQITDGKQKHAAITSEEAPAADKGPETGGRMIIVGDSDFLTNGYLSLSGNKEFGLRIFQWLAKDDRFIEVQKPQFKFKPLLLDIPKQSLLVFSVLAVYPLLFIVIGGLYLVIRLRTS